MSLRIAALALVTAATALGAQAPAGSAALILRPGDAIRVQIGLSDRLMRAPGENGPKLGLEQDFPVLEGGSAMLPLIGVVEVAGRPFGEVREEIRQRYARELVDAPVLVTPILRIAVLGEVRQPGLVPVDPTLTIADVVAAAGGLTPRGDPGKIMLVRGENTTRISLTGTDAGASGHLAPGDQLVVGRQSWFRENINVLVPSAASVLAAVITTLLLR